MFLQRMAVMAIIASPNVAVWRRNEEMSLFVSQIAAEHVMWSWVVVSKIFCLRCKASSKAKQKLFVLGASRWAAISRQHLAIAVI